MYSLLVFFVMQCYGPKSLNQTVAAFERTTRRRVIENSAGALPHAFGARYIGKYAGDCKTNSI